MCASGQIEYVGTTTSYYTNGKKYDILTVVPAGTGNDAGVYLVRADNGSLNGVASNDANFTLVELYASVKVV